jgi:DNA-binding NtrC family response regulator
VEKPFEILVADRNPHVRELIRRELVAAGYRVSLAENGRELLRWAYQSDSLDLVVVDPNLFDVDGSLAIRKLKNRIPFVPVVVHAFSSDCDDHPTFLQTAAFVEKRGSSVARLKDVITDILNRPRRARIVDPNAPQTQKR